MLLIFIQRQSWRDIVRFTVQFTVKFQLKLATDLRNLKLLLINFASKMQQNTKLPDVPEETC